jgi:hypothetical protein
LLWGCDIEEIQPQFLIRELAAANPNDTALRTAVDMVKDGYRRQMAPSLLKLMEAATVANDRLIGHTSLSNREHR